jgi:hypothetical protein
MARRSFSRELKVEAVRSVSVRRDRHSAGLDVGSRTGRGSGACTFQIS